MSTKLKTYSPRLFPAALSVAAMLAVSLMPARPVCADRLYESKVDTIRTDVRSLAADDEIAACFKDLFDTMLEQAQSVCERCGEIEELRNAVPVTGLGASEGAQLRFSLDVPAGARKLAFTLAEGTGDADLYVRRGTSPTLVSGDCGSGGGGNRETCWFVSPDPGTWYVMIHAYEAFSGAVLEARYGDVLSGYPPGSGGLSLYQDPFGIEMACRDFPKGTDWARMVPIGSDDSGIFRLFDPDNWEMQVMVLNGCGLSNHSCATTTETRAFATCS